MKSLLLLLLLIASSSETRMRVFIDGNPGGDAVLTQKLLADGSKHIIVVMNLIGNGSSKVKIRQESVYDSNGNPLRKIQEVMDASGKRQNLIIATFDESGAIHAVHRGGKPQETRVPLANGAPRSNPSEFWFIKSKPKEGDKVAYYRYDVAAMKWTLTESKFVGQKEILINGKKVIANLIDSGKDGLAYLDDTGNPLLLQTGKIRMVRQ